MAQLLRVCRRLGCEARAQQRAARHDVIAQRSCVRALRMRTHALTQKFVRQLRPWTSSTRRRILRYASSSFCNKHGKQSSSATCSCAGQGVLCLLIAVTPSSGAQHMFKTFVQHAKLARRGMRGQRAAAIARAATACCRCVLATRHKAPATPSAGQQVKPQRRGP